MNGAAFTFINMEIFVTKFKGTYEELKALIIKKGCDGVWSDILNGKQLKIADGGILNWFPATGKINFQGTSVGIKRLNDAFLVENILDSEVLPTSVQNGHNKKEKVFVVHGHDTASREQLELVLHKLGLDPYVLANTGGGGLTIIEALEKEIGGYADAARFGIVLMTPDDIGYSRRDGEEKSEPRARQNVVLEMGMLISALGRPNVAILKKGSVEVPSDADGILYIGFNDHVKETVPRLTERLSNSGFKFDTRSIAKAAS